MLHLIINIHGIPHLDEACVVFVFVGDDVRLERLHHRGEEVRPYRISTGYSREG